MSAKLEEMVRMVVGAYRKKDEASKESCNRMTVAANSDEDNHTKNERIRRVVQKSSN